MNTEKASDLVCMSNPVCPQSVCIHIYIYIYIHTHTQKHIAVSHSEIFLLSPMPQILSQ